MLQDRPCSKPPLWTASAARWRRIFDISLSAVLAELALGSCYWFWVTVGGSPLDELVRAIPAAIFVLNSIVIVVASHKMALRPPRHPGWRIYCSGDNQRPPAVSEPHMTASATTAAIWRAVRAPRRSRQKRNDLAVLRSLKREITAILRCGTLPANSLVQVHSPLLSPVMVDALSRRGGRVIPVSAIRRLAGSAGYLLSSRRTLIVAAIVTGRPAMIWHQPTIMVSASDAWRRCAVAVAFDLSALRFSG